MSKARISKNYLVVPIEKCKFPCYTERSHRKIYEDGKVTYMPVYLVMFIESEAPAEDDSEYLF